MKVQLVSDAIASFELRPATSTPDRNSSDWFNIDNLEWSSKVKKELDNIERVGILSKIGSSFLRYDIDFVNNIKANIGIITPTGTFTHDFPTRLSCEDEIKYKGVNLSLEMDNLEKKFVKCMNDNKIEFFNDLSATLTVPIAIPMKTHGDVIVKITIDKISKILFYIMSFITWLAVTIFLEKEFFRVYKKILDKLIK